MDSFLLEICGSAHCAARRPSSRASSGKLVLSALGFRTHRFSARVARRGRSLEPSKVRVLLVNSLVRAISRAVAPRAPNLCDASFVPSSRTTTERRPDGRSFVGGVVAAQGWFAPTSRDKPCGLVKRWRKESPAGRQGPCQAAGGRGVGGVSPPRMLALQLCSNSFCRTWQLGLAWLVPTFASELSGCCWHALRLTLLLRAAQRAASEVRRLPAGESLPVSVLAHRIAGAPKVRGSLCVRFSRRFII